MKCALYNVRQFYMLKNPEISHRTLLSQEAHPNDRSLYPYIRQILKYLAIHKLVNKPTKFIQNVHVTISNLKIKPLTHSLNQSITHNKALKLLFKEMLIQQIYHLVSQAIRKYIHVLAYTNFDIYAPKRLCHNKSSG